MNEIQTGTGNKSSKSTKRNAAIDALLEEYAPSPQHDLLSQMMVTVCRLANDGADRGEIKILNTALKELRYAFKIFKPYGHIPKVTIFGSSRTAEDHPEYIQAQQFAERIEMSLCQIRGRFTPIQYLKRRLNVQGSRFIIVVRLKIDSDKYQNTRFVVAHSRLRIDAEFNIAGHPVIEWLKFRGDIDQMDIDDFDVLRNAIRENESF